MVRVQWRPAWLEQDAIGCRRRPYGLVFTGTMCRIPCSHHVETFAVPERPYRKPLRYRGHDYHAPCCVHVTVCTHARQRLFGTVTTDGIHLNDAGQFVAESLRSFHSDEAGVGIDAHIVMPDHLHAIITLGTNPNVDTTVSISDVVQRFKMRVIRSWPTRMRTRSWAPYETHLWQRSLNDVLIEHDRHLEATRAYILANPARWLEKHHS